MTEDTPVADPDGERRRLEMRFHEAMVNVYRNAKSEAGYVASRFLQMVAEQGGLATAKQLINAETVSDGYTRLWELGRLDLSVEAQALRREFRPLFSDPELQICRERLRDYGFSVEQWLATQ